MIESNHVLCPNVKKMVGKLFKYKGQTYVYDGTSMHKNQTTRVWERVVVYHILNLSGYFMRDEKDFFQKFKIIS